MKAGFFETDITPAVGMEKPGGYGKAYIGAFHDALKVRAGVLDDGARRVALVGIDTAIIAARTATEARREIEERCGIPGSNVMIGASHTHSGGPLFGAFPDELDDAPHLVRRLALEHSTCIDLLYHEWVVRQIVTAVCEADRRREPAAICVGSGQESVSAFNRRFRMRNGRSATHPGKGNPDIVEPAGPIDPEVGVVAARATDGRWLGCIVNYACHGTTFSGGCSADWIHYLVETVRDGTNGEMVPVFLNGACGDVTQVDNQSMREREFGEKWSRHVGTRVGAEVLKVLVTAERAENPALAVASRTLRIPRRPPTPESVEDARQLVLDGMDAEGKSGDWTFAKERVMLDYLVHEAPAVDCEIQAIQIGPAVFLANPAEYFCQLGLDIKAGTSFPFTYVVELANGGIGYVPDDEAFSEAGGGYETVLTSYSNLVPEAGRTIVEASIELAAQLTPGRAPETELPPPSTPPQVWDYGRRGPELE